MKGESEKLARKAAAGDTAAFGRLYELYFDKIYSFINYRCLHRETAEDICSKVFLKALSAIDGFDAEKGNFNGWLYRIASNSLTDHFRKNGRYETVSDIWDIPSEEDPLVDVHNRLYWEKLKPVFDGLDSSKKEVIMMRIWDGLSFREIAELTGKSEAACKMSFRRTLDLLKASAPLSTLLLLFAMNSNIG